MTKFDSNSVNLIDAKKAEVVKAAIHSEPTIKHLGEFFKVIGDVTRLKIILALAKGELCVCDLAAVIGVSPSAVSHQLRILRGARLVKYRREGKIVYYSPEDQHVEHILEDALNHLKESL
jgi:ArsR family transcriptional regulator